MTTAEALKILPSSIRCVVDFYHFLDVLRFLEILDDYHPDDACCTLLDPTEENIPLSKKLDDLNDQAFEVFGDEVYGYVIEYKERTEKIKQQL